MMVWNSPPFLQECRKCPGSDKLQKLLADLLEENAIKHATLKQWISKEY
jgi:hypothetical protein